MRFHELAVPSLHLTNQTVSDKREDRLQDRQLAGFGGLTFNAGRVRTIHGRMVKCRRSIFVGKIEPSFGIALTGDVALARRIPPR